MLEIKNVYKTFNAGTVNEKRALKNLNLSVADGDFVTVIGGNGAGKSTMLNAITGALAVDYGSITSTAWMSPTCPSISAPSTVSV